MENNIGVCKHDISSAPFIAPIMEDVMKEEQQEAESSDSQTYPTITRPPSTNTKMKEISQDMSTKGLELNAANPDTTLVVGADSTTVPTQEVSENENDGPKVNDESKALTAPSESELESKVT
mmetsp:Transcript_24166/g.27943  ORF Transcript_24166/g.27943 Transcript_24166/m.27943 type:complete len:122 (-) Transcript_24166:156-521(-)